jgi:hypothetical protein
MHGHALFPSPDDGEERNDCLERDEKQGGKEMKEGRCSNGRNYQRAGDSIILFFSGKCQRRSGTKRFRKAFEGEWKKWLKNKRKNRFGA